MDSESIKNGLIELVGATCTSCSFAIEHMGEKLPEVKDIWVDREHSCIYVDYIGDSQVLTHICEFVQQIGYQATIIKTQ